MKNKITRTVLVLVLLVCSLTLSLFIALDPRPGFNLMLGFMAIVLGVVAVIILFMGWKYDQKVLDINKKTEVKSNV